MLADIGDMHRNLPRNLPLYELDDCECSIRGYWVGKSRYMLHLRELGLDEEAFPHPRSNWWPR